MQAMFSLVGRFPHERMIDGWFGSELVVKYKGALTPDELTWTRASSGTFWLFLFPPDRLQVKETLSGRKHIYKWYKKNLWTLIEWWYQTWWFQKGERNSLKCVSNLHCWLHATVTDSRQIATDIHHEMLTISWIKITKSKLQSTRKQSDTGVTPGIKSSNTYIRQIYNIVTGFLIYLFIFINVASRFTQNLANDT